MPTSHLPDHQPNTKPSWGIKVWSSKCNCSSTPLPRILRAHFCLGKYAHVQQCLITAWSFRCYSWWSNRSKPKSSLTQWCNNYTLWIREGSLKFLGRSLTSYTCIISIVFTYLLLITKTSQNASPSFQTKLDPDPHKGGILICYLMLEVWSEVDLISKQMTHRQWTGTSYHSKFCTKSSIISLL